MSYKEISQRKLAELDAQIPTTWRLQPSQIPPGMLSPAESITNVQHDRISVIDIPRTCGLLSARELALTEHHDVRSLLRVLATQQATAEEVITAFSKRAAIAHQLTRCLTEPLFARALARARDLDAHLRRTGTPLGPLHGLPVSVKDSFHVEGVDATIGLAALAHQPAAHDAPLITLLTSLGAVVIAKTNVPQTLGALDSANYLFGRTLNPLNRQLTAGGSSGGEGVLVAMHGAMVGFGTDIGGSIRVPALCNAIYGFKPSVGRVPYGGQASGQLDGKTRIALQPVAGPLARSVDDLGAVMEHIVPRAELFGEDCIPGFWGPFPKPTPNPSPGPGPTNPTSTSDTKLRIGILRSDGLVEPLPPITRVLNEVASLLHHHPNIDLIDVPVPAALPKCQGLAGRLMGVDDGGPMVDLLTATDEPLIPWLRGRMALKRQRPLTVEQLAGLQAQRAVLEREMLGVWSAPGGAPAGTASTGLGKERVLDAIILPAAPHPIPELDRWNAVGYASSFVLLDYPAGVIPVRRFGERDLELGVEMTGPVRGSWDKANRALWDEKTVDRRVYLDSPLGIQVVTPKQHDYDLFRAMKIIDAVVQAERTRESSARL